MPVVAWSFHLKIFKSNSKFVYPWISTKIKRKSWYHFSRFEFFVIFQIGIGVGAYFLYHFVDDRKIFTLWSCGKYKLHSFFYEKRFSDLFISGLSQTGHGRHSIHIQPLEWGDRLSVLLLQLRMCYVNRVEADTNLNSSDETIVKVHKCVTMSVDWDKKARCSRGIVQVPEISIRFNKNSYFCWQGSVIILYTIFPVINTGTELLNEWLHKVWKAWE